MSSTYDCCILGAGIAGTTSALVLARMGLRVLVVEAGEHPRFAIGESLVPTTTLGFDYLARTYGIPELRQVSHYPAMAESNLTGWPKLGFWFGHQREGVTVQAGHEMMFTTPGLPLGPDVHMLRADTDRFLASRLADYGVDYHDRTSVADWHTAPDHTTLQLARRGQKQSVRTRFVLDCSGHKSFLARSKRLRESPTRLRTDTRTIYSHFRNVRYLEDVIGKPSARFGARRDAGTLHHCFEGGWFWIIRFDNGISSVGLVLNRDSHPDNDLNAKEEFWSFVNRFPTVRAQLSGATSTRPLVKSGRLQFTSHRIYGDRYLLAPHAASFVDPLFSTGMDLTTAFVARMAPIVAAQLKDDIPRTDGFRAIEACHQAEIDFIDRIVHGMLCSFRCPDVFKQYWRFWVNASLLQYFIQLCHDPADEAGMLAHYGASLPTWNRQLERMYKVVTANNVTDTYDLAVSLKAIMDEFPELCDREQSNWEIESQDACCPFIRPDESIAWFEGIGSIEPDLAARTHPDLLAQAQRRFRAAENDFQDQYESSLAKRTPFHRAVNFIRAQQL